MGFPRQDYWSGLPFPPPEDLPVPGIEPTSPTVAGGFFTTEPPEKPNGASLKQSESFSNSVTSDPMDCSRQPPRFIEFSKQEYWSGLPFPSPMHESEKEK